MIFCRTPCGSKDLAGSTQNIFFLLVGVLQILVPIFFVQTEYENILGLSCAKLRQSLTSLLRINQPCCYCFSRVPVTLHVWYLTVRMSPMEVVFHIFYLPGYIVAGCRGNKGDLPPFFLSLARLALTWLAYCFILYIDDFWSMGGF